MKRVRKLEAKAKRTIQSKRPEAAFEFNRQALNLLLAELRSIPEKRAELNKRMAQIYRTMGNDYRSLGYADKGLEQFHFAYDLDPMPFEF